MSRAQGNLLAQINGISGTQEMGMAENLPVGVCTSSIHACSSSFTYKTFMRVHLHF